MVESVRVAAAVARPGARSGGGRRRGCRRRSPRAVACVAAALACVAVGEEAQAQRTLRYAFEPGQRLIYERRVTIEALEDTGGPHEAVLRTQVQVWSLAGERDERLLLLDLTAPAAGGDRVRGGVVYVDPYGVRRWPEEMRARYPALEEALEVVPHLPLPVQEEQGWLSPPDLYGRQWRCVNRGPDADRGGRLRVEFELADRTGASDLLGIAQQGRFWFDPAALCIERVELTTADATRGLRTHVVAVLQGRLTLPAAWAQRRAQEAARYLRVLRHEDRLLREIVTQPDALDRTRTELDRLWAGFASDVDSRADSPFRVLAEDRRRELRELAARFARRAELGRRWINRRARPWTLPDASGRMRTSEEVRRGVMIECFWASDSVAGVRALEVMKRLQKALPAGARLVCYNMEPFATRPPAALERCGAGLEHVLAGPLQSVEALDEFPVVWLLDARGVVRDVRIGWQPEYPELLTRCAACVSGAP